MLLRKPIFSVLTSTAFLAVMFAFICSATPVVIAAGEDGENKAVADEIHLLQPISGGDTIPIKPGVGTWLLYFERAGSWLYKIAVGFCVIWVLIGGMQIMIMGGYDSSKRSEGFDKIKSSIIGLVILSFSGAILKTLNSLFYT